MASPAGNSAHSLPITPGRETIVTLDRSRGRYRVVSRRGLRNSLLAGVGYLELANAGDFPANVWNTIPVPRHAVILMAIGGPIAILMSLVAARDLYLSWKNVAFLYSERRDLLAIPCPNGKTSAVLRVNTRELGTEVIDRIFMDLLLGFGALLVGTGTIMAIWGADHRVFQASNLLSGFVGNSFAVIFGVINACWSAYLVYRFRIRYAICHSDPAVQTVRHKLRQRFRSFQWHAGINGLNGLVAGMASMVTARMWWGYVVLIPCVVVMIAGNLFWKIKLGYDRPAVINPLDNVIMGDKNTADDAGADDVLNSLLSVEAAQGRLHDLVEIGSMESILSFLEETQMLEGFCAWIVGQWPHHPVFAASETVIISCEALKAGTEDDKMRMQEKCRRFLHEGGNTLLLHRERYLLELVGEVVFKRSI